MNRPIGYYVHHQGHGHWQRACLIAMELSRPVTLMGTFGPDRIAPSSITTLDLPDDRIDPIFNGVDHQPGRPKAFHYAPLAVDGIRHRMSMIAAWCADNDPALFIVDVSVEVALFLRLLSVPTAVMRLAGPRVDCPHLEAFRSAAIVLAPFPCIFESKMMPGWVREKTVYSGFLANASARRQSSEAGRVIVVVLGLGGEVLDKRLFIDAALAIPDFDWQVFGPTAPVAAGPSNLSIRGWCDDIGPLLDAAVFVIGGAGDGLLADVAVRAKRFICVPEDRAFDEQRDKARVLAARDMALVLEQWPAADEWPDILRRAATLDPMKLHAEADDNAISYFAAAIEALAASHESRTPYL